MIRRPCRRASLMIALKLVPRTRCMQTASLATSGSIVRVVRIRQNITSAML